MSGIWTRRDRGRYQADQEWPLERRRRAVVDEIWRTLMLLRTWSSGGLMWSMEDDLIVKALRDKRAEIHGRITAYEAQIEHAKHDLAHVNATLRLFTDVEKQRARYVVSHGFFRKGEFADLCALQLDDGSELTTRALAERGYAGPRNHFCYNSLTTHTPHLMRGPAATHRICCAARS